MSEILNPIRVRKMAHPVQCGDWHDKSLRWEVVGPNDEVQRFITKVGAETYASLRRRHTCMGSALRAWLAIP